MMQLLESVWVGLAQKVPTKHYYFYLKNNSLIFVKLIFAKDISGQSDSFLKKGKVLLWTQC